MLYFNQLSYKPINLYAEIIKRLFLFWGKLNYRNIRVYSQFNRFRNQTDEKKIVYFFMLL